MQRFIIKLLIDNSAKIFKSVANAYQDIVRNSGGKAAASSSGNAGKKPDPFANWSFSDIIGTNQMSKSEALKILSFSENEKLNSRKIIERFEKYFEMNDPKNGGSFYLQNKFFYAKEVLIKDFLNEDTTSKFDYLTSEDYVSYQQQKKNNKV